jgi:hypothetical protein
MIETSKEVEALVGWLVGSRENSQGFWVAGWFGRREEKERKMGLQGIGVKRRLLLAEIANRLGGYEKIVC